jgi:hypothetical protein
MKIVEIKRLALAHSSVELIKAEEDLIEERPIDIQVEGVDEGEKLTHVMAAIFVKSYMETNNVDVNKAIRTYSQRVRESLEQNKNTAHHRADDTLFL